MTRRSGDGAGLLAAFRAAVDNLAEHVDEVNKLNVFPVPDGDTGSNMLATVRAALAEAEAAVGEPVERVAGAISYGALMGARGNSGVIASQIFRGMAEGLGGKVRLDGADLARSLRQGSSTAYQAVVKPVEGTILTVVREAAEAAEPVAAAGGDLESVLIAAVRGAEEAVAKTPTMLAELRNAGVVDAGGQGLFRLLQGALKFVVERNPPGVERPATPPRAAGAASALPEEFYGYETMFLLRPRGEPLNVDLLRAEMEELGDSVIVAGDARAVKVHIHNERPDRVIALGLSMGMLTNVTVQNLDSQSAEVGARREADLAASQLAEVGAEPGLKVVAHGSGHGRAAHDGRPRVEEDTYGGAAGSVSGGERDGSNGHHDEAEVARTLPLAVVAVAAGDGLARIFESFGVAAVVRGGQSANPSTGELLDAIEKIAAEEVLLLPNNPNVVLAARQAAEMSTRRVRVVPTRNAAEGYAALLAMADDRDATANAEFMTLAGRAVQTVLVTEAVRDATVGEHKVRQGQTIVLDPDDGLLAVDNDCVRAVVAAMKALEPGFELVTVYYGDGVDPAEAEQLAERIRGWRPELEIEVRFGGQPHYRYLIAAE